MDEKSALPLTAGSLSGILCSLKGVCVGGLEGGGERVDFSHLSMYKTASMSYTNQLFVARI